MPVPWSKGQGTPGHLSLFLLLSYFWFLLPSSNSSSPPSFSFPFQSPKCFSLFSMWVQRDILPFWSKEIRSCLRSRLKITRAHSVVDLSLSHGIGIDSIAVPLFVDRETAMLSTLARISFSFWKSWNSVLTDVDLVRPGCAINSEAIHKKAINFEAMLRRRIYFSHKENWTQVFQSNRQQ